MFAIIIIDISLMGDWRYRSEWRILPLKLLLIGNVNYPVADIQQTKRRGEYYSRHSVDVRHAVYVPSWHTIAAFSIVTSRFSLPATPTILNINYYRIISFIVNIRRKEFFVYFTAIFATNFTMCGDKLETIR